jgi:integrase
MARQLHTLTPEKIMSLAAGRHADGGGLYLQVLPGGTRSWLFRYDMQSKSHWLGLGPVNAGKLGDCLSEARRKAGEARAQVRDGRDPLAIKRAQAAERARSELATDKTFSEAARAYLAAHESGWRSPIHARQWRQCLDDYMLPVVGKLMVADVGPGDVKRVLRPLWTTKPEVARKVCGKVGMILNFAIANEWRTKANPATLLVMRTILGPLQQKPAHHPAVPYKELPDLMRKIENREDTAALALQWLILTATRSSEARCPTWDEIDLPGKRWKVPAARMKSGEPHTVPLSLAALSVLDRVKRRVGCAFVFVAQGSDPVSETALRNLLRELGVTKDTGSLHGMRSSFRDYCAETGVADDVAEACLAHAVPDAVVKAYKRTRFLEARTDVMERWGLYLS